MATAILRSQDCLRGRFRHEALTLALPRSVGSRRSPNFSTRNPNYGSNANLQQSRRRKRSPTGLGSNLQDRGRDRYAADRAVVAKAPAKNLVMGEVKILRRGEALVPEKDNSRGIGVVAGDDRRKPMAAKSDEDPDLALGSTDRLGPDPETVQKQIKAAEFKVMDAIYAGSSAFYASPPPSSVPLPGFLGRNGAATTDLRRLLRLDLV